MEKHRFSYVDTERAAREIVRGVKRGKRLIIPGAMNKLIYRVMDMLPRRILVVLAEKIFRYEKYRITGVEEE
jgi:short-subunit dehydrogenase